jgi:hypothetical protein
MGLSPQVIATRVRQPFATLGREGKTPLSAERLVLRRARPSRKELAGPLEPSSAEEVGKSGGRKLRSAHRTEQS